MLYLILEIVIGIGLGIITIDVANNFHLTQKRFFFPMMLIIIAMAYAIFAIWRSPEDVFNYNATVAAFFVLLSLWGYYHSLSIVIVGLIAHGIFDALYVNSVQLPTPIWYPDLCLGYDAFLAYALYQMISQDEIALKRT